MPSTVVTYGYHVCGSRMPIVLKFTPPAPLANPVVEPVSPPCMR